MPRDDEAEPPTDEVEPGTDWETAEVPRSAAGAELHRRVPRPCGACGGLEWIVVKQHRLLAHALGLAVGSARVQGEAQVCRQCGLVRWFVRDPEALLADPDFAATVQSSR